MKKAAEIIIAIIALYALLPTIALSACTTPSHEIRINGTSFYFYNGSKIAQGNATAITVENQEKAVGLISNGDWSLVFSGCTQESEFIGLKITDNSKVVGYDQIKIVTDNPSTAIISCTVQNVSLSGYAIDINDGSPLSGGNVKASVLDTTYINTTSFSGSNWSIDFYPCLVSGKIYTLDIVIANTGGTRTGEYLTSYLAG